MITATLRINASEAKKAEIIRLLRSLIEPTRVETGCLGCRLYQEVNDGNALSWVEEWKTQQNLEQHLKSAQYAKILAALEMSDAQPEVRFDTVAETHGIQLIAEARGIKN